MKKSSCPVCGNDGLNMRTLSSEFICNQLECYFGEQPPAVGIRAYNILQCRNCSLEYANPMMPGTSAFYDWINRHSYYYPDRRWEYEVVIAEINKVG